MTVASTKRPRELINFFARAGWQTAAERRRWRLPHLNLVFTDVQASNDTAGHVEKIVHRGCCKHRARHKVSNLKLEQDACRRQRSQPQHVDTYNAREIPKHNSQQTQTHKDTKQTHTETQTQESDTNEMNDAATMHVYEEL